MNYGVLFSIIDFVTKYSYFMRLCKICCKENFFTIENFQGFMICLINNLEFMCNKYFKVSEKIVLINMKNDCLFIIFRISLNTMTLQVESPTVYTCQGVPISVTGIAQVKICKLIIKNKLKIE